MHFARRGWLWTLLAALLGLGSLGLAETASAQRFRIELERPQVRARFSVGTRRAPPAARVEVRPPAPQYGMVWQPGFWDFDGRNHVWVAGRWSQQRQGYVWREPRWERRNDGWVLIRGSWVAAPTSYPPPPVYGTPTYRETPTTRPGYRMRMPDRRRAVTLPPGSAYGQPQSFNAVRGNRGGYWVWIDQNGVFHLHASSNRPQQFHGRILSDEGGLVRLAGRMGVDPDDVTLQDGQGITFDWTTRSGGQDGIMFSVEGRCARLYLTSNPAPDPSRGYGSDQGGYRSDSGYRRGYQRAGTRVRVGRNQIPVRGNHLIVCR